jgi:hypothetical protein
MATQGRRPDVDEDLAFQLKDWRVQRAGWAVLTLILAAGLSGLFGPGPLSNATASDGYALHVQYERFVRHGGQTNLTVRLASADPGPLQVTIGREYLSAFHVRQILPAPVRVQAGDSDLVYTFEGPRQSGPVELKFFLQPESLGSHAGNLSAGPGPAVTLRQFTYP